jgi:predicted GTPase
LDGVKFQQLAFSDGTNKPITYAPPRGWAYSGSVGALSLHPAKKTQAEATISAINRPKPILFDEDGMKQLVDDVMTGVPKGSTNVTLVSQTKNAVMIERKETFLVIISFTLFTETFERSVMFLNRPQDQIRFVFTARQADFQELQRAFFDSQFSWQNL